MPPLAAHCINCLLWAGAVPAQEAPVAGGPFCPIVFQVPERPVIDVALEQGDTYINADRIDHIEQGVSELQGAVEMSTDEWQARADRAVYNDPGEYVDLSGDVKFWEGSLFLSGDSAHIDVEDSTARVTGADYYLRDNEAWGKADDLFIDPGIETSGENMGFTTCAPDNGGGIEENFWRISARQLTLNHETERGSGRDIVLRIKDIPVFYSPYFTFPLNRERKSGFLAPGIGKNGHGGFETRIPYYWNISPNMDATITPRALANSGVMGMLEYRYLLKRGEGRVNLEYLPGDVGFDDRDRSLINIELNQDFLDRGHFYAVYNLASDPEYLEDFGTELAVSSTRYLPRRADLTYRGNNWSLLGRLHSYQIMDQSIRVTSRPYKNLPRLQLKYFPLRGNKRINLRLDTDLTYFDRTGEAGVTVDVTGFRADLYPSISYPIRTQAAFLVPKVGVRFTQYELDKQGPFEKSPSRTVPICQRGQRRVPGARPHAAGQHLPAHAGTPAVLPVRAARGPDRPAGIRFIGLQPGLQRPVPGKPLQRLRPHRRYQPGHAGPLQPAHQPQDRQADRFAPGCPVLLPGRPERHTADTRRQRGTGGHRHRGKRHAVTPGHRGRSQPA